VAAIIVHCKWHKTDVLCKHDNCNVSELKVEMEYLVIVSICLVLVLIVVHQLNLNTAEKQIDKIRKKWSKPKTDPFNFDSIGKYVENVPSHNFHRLSDQTIDDIDFYSLFAFVDRTISKVGQQFFFKKLLEPVNTRSHDLENFIHLFTINEVIREQVQLQLVKLSNRDAYNICELLKPNLLRKPKWFKLLSLNLVLLVTLLFFSIKFSIAFVLLIVPVSLNIFLHYWNKANTFRFSRSFNQLDVLLNVSKALMNKNDQFFDKSVHSSISKLQSFQRIVTLIEGDRGGGLRDELSQLFTYVIELLKAIFLVEVFTLFKITKELEDKQSDILIVFNYVGRIDSSLSIASLRMGDKETCLPSFTSASKTLVVMKMYHPLIEDCVPNDLTIDGKGILITGSNMSGKSTFLRTILINSILAQTINTCFADEFSLPVVKQFSCIRIDDNIFEGKSYYFEEVKVISSLLEQVEFRFQNLFVLDEVFRGTNAVERIAAAKAVLSYLNRNANIVIVSTHDIELAELLAEEYDLYHFTETVENDELCFDHTIKEGLLKTRNAIRMLELAEFPIEVTTEAKQISTVLMTKRINEKA
jgi:hypothetical protein